MRNVFIRVATKLSGEAVLCHLAEQPLSFLTGDLKVLMRAGGKERHGLPGAILSWHRAFRDGTANKLAQSRWEEALQLVIESPVASAEGWLDRARICLTKANEAATTSLAYPAERECPRRA